MNKGFLAFFIISLILLGLVTGYFFAILGRKNSDNNEPAATRELVNNKTNCVLGSFLNSQPDFFNSAFAKVIKQNLKIVPSAKGLIVSHHLLADELIAKAFQAVSSAEDLTIVLISPDHFDHGSGLISSSNCDWRTPYGVLSADTSIIKKLEQNKLVVAENEPFAEEHGIFNLIPFIKKSFPRAKLVPLILKDKIKPEFSYKLAQELKNVLPQNSLVVASVDFTHELSGLAADFHDAKSLSVLSSFDYSGLDRVDVDSKPTLRALLRYLDLVKAKKFTMLDNSNSAKLLSNPKILDATSYITGYFTAGEMESIKQVTILSFGDLMLDRYIRNRIEISGENYLFEDIKRFLSGSDLVIANLEGSFTDFKPKPLMPNNLLFTFDPGLVPVLADYGFNVFNLANNHSLNFGEEGLEQSKDYLNKAAIEYFGHPDNNKELSLVKEIRDQKIGFIGYNQLTEINFDRILAEVEKLDKEVDWLIVFTHWGAEYQVMDFNSLQQAEAHQLIDAGADIIIGSHPHVIQPVEIYQNKVIFYSLGNFIFDQTFSRETTQGLGVGLILGEDAAKFYLFPLDIHQLKVNLLSWEEASKIWQDLAKFSEVPEEVKARIRAGFFEIEK